MKVAIATDTNSGITAKEGARLGVYVLAMPVNLESSVHYEGIDITSEELYDAMRQHRDVSTSQPSPASAVNPSGNTAVISAASSSLPKFCTEI